MFDLDIGDLDAPALCRVVQDCLDVRIELFALGEHVVQLVLTDYRAQRGLRELTGCLDAILHLNDGFLGVNDAEVNDRVHFHRHVVATDHVLRRHVLDLKNAMVGEDMNRVLMRKFVCF